MNDKNIPILKKLLDTSQNILLQVHANPDPDTIGSALAWYEYLKNQGKSTRIICPTDIQKSLINLFDDISEVEFDVDFSKVDYSEFDLFLINDTAGMKQLSYDKTTELPDMNIFMIDHHSSNDFHEIPRILEPEIIANSEVLFDVFKSLEIDINEKMATYLLGGIYTDAFFFKAAGITPETFFVCSELMKLGADFEYLQKKLINSKSVVHLNGVGKALSNMHIDHAGSMTFSWTFISNEDYKKYGEDYSIKDVISDEYISTIEDTDFGFMMIELKKGIIKFSLRSNNDFDVSQIAIALGGGGHKHSAGGTIENENPENIINKVKSFIK